MRKKNYLFYVLLIFFCTPTNAQEKKGVSSITLGVSPYGYSSSTLFRSSEEDSKTNELNCDYYYKNVMAANLCYEYQSGGHSFLAELSYARGDFDYYKIKGETMTYNVYKTKPFQDYALNLYYGVTLIGKGKRVQLPVYIGAGTEHVKGGALNNFEFSLAAKLRLKFYISNHLGIYVGGTGRWALLGSITDKNPDSDKKNDELDPMNILCTPDAGIIISF